MQTSTSAGAASLATMLFDLRHNEAGQGHRNERGTSTTTPRDLLLRSLGVRSVGFGGTGCVTCESDYTGAAIIVPFPGVIG